MYKIPNICFSSYHEANTLQFLLITKTESKYHNNQNKKRPEKPWASAKTSEVCATLINVSKLTFILE